MPRAQCIAVLLVLVLWGPLSASAQTSGWGLSLGIPFDARFSVDPQAPTPAPARFPTGLRAAALSPFHLGFGLAVIRTGFDSPLFPFADRTMTVRLGEVQALLPYEEFRFGLGLGLGSARFRPVSATSGPLTQEYLESPAREWFLVTAYRLEPRWELEVGLHLLRINLRYRTNGAPAEGNLEARLLTAGVGYRF